MAELGPLWVDAASGRCGGGLPAQFAQGGSQELGSRVGVTGVRMSSAAMEARNSNTHGLRCVPSSLLLPWDAQETSTSQAQSKLTVLFKCTVIDVCHWHVPFHSQHVTCLAAGEATRSLTSPWSLLRGSCS